MAGKWTDDEKREIFEVFCALAVSLKSYGNSDHKARLRAWELILANEMTGNEVCSAMVAHAKASDEMPTPSDLLKIKNPPPKQITTAEFIHAKEQHALEGFPRFGYYGQIIRDYEAQRGQETSVPSTYQVLENRQSAPQIPDKVKEILAITYGGKK